MAQSVKEGRLEALHEEFTRLGLRGFWQQRPAVPRPVARVWKWADIHACLMEASEIIRLGPDAERRFIGVKTESPTLAMGYQIVMPGEVASAHHHTASALRFVVEGQGAYTTSNGERMIMESNDFLTQPNWVWHDHTNGSNDPIIWLDCLDGGLVRTLGGQFSEEWTEGLSQPLIKPDGYSRALALTRPPGITNWATPMNYKWTDTWAVLNMQEGPDPYDGTILEYINPITGGHTFLNIACYVQMLRPGESTQAHRHNGSTIYHVISGAGEAIVGQRDRTHLEWADKDTFTLPEWEWHSLQNASNTEPALLFSISDRPVLESTGLYREQGA